MKLKVIGLGSDGNRNSLGNELIASIGSGDFVKLVIFSAFTSPAAIGGMKELIKDSEKLNDVTIITGVDQKGTSKEALEELLNSNFKTFVYYAVMNKT